MVTNKAVPAVRAVYPDGDAIWQDDPASIHRTQAALDACLAFEERIPHNQQAAKCSDIWPIEQVSAWFWSFLLALIFFLSRSGEFSNIKSRGLTPKPNQSSGLQSWLLGRRWMPTRTCSNAWWSPSPPVWWPASTAGASRSATATTNPRRLPTSKAEVAFFRGKFTLIANFMTNWRIMMLWICNPRLRIFEMKFLMKLP